MSGVALTGSPDNHHVIFTNIHPPNIKIKRAKLLRHGTAMQQILPGSPILQE